MGIKTWRKGNVLKDLFLPTYPSDYKGLVSEFKSAFAKKKGIAPAVAPSCRCYSRVQRCRDGS